MLKITSLLLLVLSAHAGDRPLSAQASKPKPQSRISALVSARYPTATPAAKKTITVVDLSTKPTPMTKTERCIVGEFSKDGLLPIGLALADIGAVRCAAKEPSSEEIANCLLKNKKYTSIPLHYQAVLFAHLDVARRNCKQ